MPTGTLINEVRIQVQNVIVTGGIHPTMLFSGIVSPSSNAGTGATGTTGTVTIGEAGIPIPAAGGTGEPGSPVSPNLFGNLQGNAASVSLAFMGSFQFPGISSTSGTGATAGTGSTGTGTGVTGSTGTGGTNTGTGVTGSTGTGSTNTGTGVTGGTGTGSTGTGTTGVGFGSSTGPFGTSGAVPISLLSVNVAGAFDLAAPTGFATVDVAGGGSTGGTGATGSPSSGPVIQLAPFNFQTASRSITLDASQSSSSNGGLTFNWTVTGSQQANVVGDNTANPTIQYPTSGTFQIQLTVTDSTGASSSMVIPITVL
jgi:hypothetical protein